LENRHPLFINALTFILVLTFIGAASALPPAPRDYDAVTGEPRCASCHNGEKKYSIDYTREPSCFSCHGPGLSERYIAINRKDRQYGSGNSAVMVASAAAPGKSGVKVAALHKGPGQRAAGVGARRVKAVRKAPFKDMVYVPPGYFTMGSDDWWPKSQPEHKRYVKGFYIDKYEVTNERYAAFVRATGHAAPPNWSGGRIPPGKADYPVTFVSWHDADAFCRWDGKHLPREDQWEKAARGTDGRAFPWGDKFSRKKANTPQFGFGNTMAVGSFPDGVSPYGAYDMAGNVWEWVDDWFKPYPGNKHPDENYGERFKVLRGGSWYDCTYYKCGISAPSYNRIFFNPDTRNNNFGFRCAVDEGQRSGAGGGRGK